MNDRAFLEQGFYRHVAQTSDFPIGLVIDRAEGPWLYTHDGRVVLDLISGIAVSSLGHRHPEVVAAVHEQVDRHMHVMVYGEFIQAPQSEFASLLASQLPESLSRVYFVNSGTEANEGALKLAKKYTGRRRLLAFRNSYHGDTQGSLSVTGRDVYRDPFLPLLPDVGFMRFNALEDLSQIDDTVAAVIVEPIQGEGGIVVADTGWLHALRKRCDETGALLIFDEIQSGFGRTGRLFAFMGYGVVPDILTMAKAMGGGMPLGGFAAADSVMGVLKDHPPLSHVTTFGGHPVSCAAGLAALRVLLREDLPRRASHIEAVIREGLVHPLVQEIRGRGCMLGLCLPDYATTEKVVQEAFFRNILLGWTLHSNTLIRLAPPLTISDEILKHAIEQLLAALDAASRN